MDVRRATPEEKGEIGALLEASGHPPLPVVIPLSNVLVGRTDGSIVGVVALEVVARRGMLFGAAVAADHQGTDTGKQLVASLIARAHELSLRQLYAMGDGETNAWSDLGFSPVASGEVPDQVKSLRTWPDAAGDADGILCMELETRL